MSELLENEVNEVEEIEFTPTSKIGNFEVDSKNKLFKVKNASADAYKKQKSFGSKLGKASLAFMTAGMSLAVESAVKLTKAQLNKQKGIYEFKDILTFELIEDNMQVASGGVGMALAGGLLFGGDGAIAGGIVGNRKTKKVIEKMIVKINVNDIDNPLIMIPLITKSTKTKSREYEEAFNMAQKLMTLLNTIANNKD